MVKLKEQSVICPDCDALVPAETPECPYCGTKFELAKESLKRDRLEESLASLYKPPYTSKNSVGIAPEALEPARNFLPPEEKPAPSKPKEPLRLSALVPFAFLLAGGQFALFALFYLIFGFEGKLILVWESTSLKIFSFLALISLFTGYKLYTKIEDSSF